MNASILFYLIFLYNISHHESYLQLFVRMCFQSFCVFCIQLLSHPQYSLILDCKSWCNCQQWKFYNKKCENIKKESSSSMRLKAKLLLLFPVISYINSYFFFHCFCCYYCCYLFTTTTERRLVEKLRNIVAHLLWAFFVVVQHLIY